MLIERMSWSREAITVLIDNYKKYSCLYAAGSPLYHNKYARQSALQAVADSVSPWRLTTPEEVKIKFNKLRTAFLTEKKLSVRTKKKPDDPEYVPNLWYYDKIKYIEEHIIPRGTKANYHGIESLQGAPAHGRPIQLPGNDSFEAIIPDDFNTASSSSSCSVPIGKKRKIEQEYLEDVMSISSSDVEPPQPPPPAAAEEWWTVNPGCVDPLQEFGNFVVSRLRRIRDRNILLKLEHEIQLKIMEAELKDSLSSVS